MVIIKGSKAIQALRAFRLLRVIKIFKKWKQLHVLFKILAETLKDISTFVILLFLFIFIFTLLGMEWFAYKVKINDNNELDPSGDRYPDANFNTFLQSILSVFVVLTSDYWNEIYF